MNDTMTFPQYRKYSNDKSFFKILSPDTFEELQIIGENYSLLQFKATILPDRNLIADMLENLNNQWDIINESIYLEKLNDCRRMLKEI